MRDARNRIELWKDGQADDAKGLGADWDTEALHGPRIRSQRLFRASLDGSQLGWVDQATGVLHIRTASEEWTVDDVGLNDWRFSADGTRVAAVASSADQSISLMIVETSTGDQKKVSIPHLPDKLEWLRDGVVVGWQQGHGRDQRNVLRYFPLEGEARTLLEDESPFEFGAAAGGTLVYYVTMIAYDRIFIVPHRVEMRVYRLDVAGDAKWVDLGAVEDPEDALTMEVSRDGSRAAVAFENFGTYLFEDGSVRKLTDEETPSLWFSPDGKRLLFASEQSVQVLDGKDSFVLKAGKKERLESVRFTHDGQVLVASGARLIRWTPGKDSGVTVARAKKDEAFVAADLHGDDLIVWRAKPPGQQH